MEGIVLLVNVNNISEERLKSKSLLYYLLTKIVEKAKLIPVLESLKVYDFPVLIPTEDAGNVEVKYMGDKGFSGGMILLTSHVYFHSWFEKRFLRLELSVCDILERERIESVLNTIRDLLGKDVAIDYSIVEWKSHKKLDF